jgi:hypothetical protein
MDPCPHDAKQLGEDRGIWSDVPAVDILEHGRGGIA